MKVKVDDVFVTSFPHNDSAVSLTEKLGVSVRLTVPSLKLDVTYMEQFKGFSIRLPSFVYSENLRGLCGENLTIPLSLQQNTYLQQPSNLPRSRVKFFPILSSARSFQDHVIAISRMTYRTTRVTLPLTITRIPYEIGKSKIRSMKNFVRLRNQLR